MKHKSGKLPKHWDHGARGFVSSEGPKATSGELRPQQTSCHAKAKALADRAGKK